MMMMMMMMVIVMTHNIILEVVTEMNLKISVFWNVTPYCLVDGYQLFGARNFLLNFGTHLTNTRVQIPEDHSFNIRFIFPTTDVSTMFWEVHRSIPDRDSEWPAMSFSTASSTYLRAVSSSRSALSSEFLANSVKSTSNALTCPCRVRTVSVKEMSSQDAPVISNTTITHITILSRRPSILITSADMSSNFKLRYLSCACAVGPGVRAGVWCSLVCHLCLLITVSTSNPPQR